MMAPAARAASTATSRSFIPAMAGPLSSRLPLLKLRGHRVLDAPATSHYATHVRTLAVLLATVGGVGYTPMAPGTAGSLVAVPLLPLLAGLRVRAPMAG